MTTATTTPTAYYRVMLVAMKRQAPFSVTSILHEVNRDGNQPLGIQQCLQTLQRMKKHGLITRGALGMFEWKE